MITKSLVLLVVLSYAIIPLTGTVSRALSGDEWDVLDDFEDIEISIDQDKLTETLKIISNRQTDPSQPLLTKDLSASSGSVKEWKSRCVIAVIALLVFLITAGILTWKHII